MSPLPGDDADVLLTALAEIKGREGRQRVLERLVEIEPTPVDGILRRLDDERWYVRRNMLTLLRELGSTPDRFSALFHLADPNERVREEAFLLALDDPDDREEAIRTGLRSDDPFLLRLALAAVETFCPGSVEEQVVERAEDPALAAPLRLGAARALEMLRRKREAPDVVRRRLAEDPPDFPAVASVLEHAWAGEPVYEALLDALCAPQDRSHRREIFDWLVDRGLPIGGPAADRLDDGRWFVRRNMLALLQEVDERPEGFSALEHCEDPDPRVRFEAMKLALEDPVEREEALRIGFRDGSERVRYLAVSGATGGEWPADQEERLLELARDDERSGRLRRAAVRALARGGSEDVRPELVDLVWKRRLFGHRLAERTEITVAVLEGLAERWPGHPDVAPVLEAARRSGDPDLREAAS